MNKTFFIRSSIPKVKYYWLGEPNIYQNMGVFYKEVGDYWEWRTPLRFSDVPEVLSVHEIPSEEVRTRLLL